MKLKSTQQDRKRHANDYKFDYKLEKAARFIASTELLIKFQFHPIQLQAHGRSYLKNDPLACPKYHVVRQRGIKRIDAIKFNYVIDKVHTHTNADVQLKCNYL